MRRGKKFKYRPYIRYFIFGFILAALAFGSIGIRLARPYLRRHFLYSVSSKVSICKIALGFHCLTNSVPYGKAQDVERQIKKLP